MILALQFLLVIVTFFFFTRNRFLESSAFLVQNNSCAKEDAFCRYSLASRPGHLSNLSLFLFVLFLLSFFLLCFILIVASFLNVRAILHKLISSNLLKIIDHPCVCGAWLPWKGRSWQRETNTLLCPLLQVDMRCVLVTYASIGWSVDLPLANESNEQAITSHLIKYAGWHRIDLQPYRPWLALFHGCISPFWLGSEWCSLDLNFLSFFNMYASLPSIFCPYGEQEIVLNSPFTWIFIIKHTGSLSDSFLREIHLYYKNLSFCFW